MKRKILVIGGLLLLSVLLIFKEDKNTKEVLVKDDININNVIALYKSDDNTNYVAIDEIPESGYIVNEEKSYCTTDNKTKVKGKIKTIDGNTIITNISKNDKCYVWFDKEKTIGDVIIANVTVKEGTPNFSQIADTDEGVYAAEDGMYGGTSYYWRGATTTNYVKFAGFCWRIIRINGDGTLRLIYDGTTCHANGTNTSESIVKSGIEYNLSRDKSYYVGWTWDNSQRTLNGIASNAKTQLESWYSSNITGTDTARIAQGKYCNDRDIRLGDTWSATGSTFYYAAYKRIYTDYTPTLSCPNGDIYILSVGLITADEAMYAGGKNQNNRQYYLYNGQRYWSMTPYNWNATYNSPSRMFFIDSSGFISDWGVSDTPGLRPVINLNADVTFSAGNGTKDNPYIVE